MEKVEGTPEYWYKWFKKADKEKVQAVFMLGWLSSVLEGTGMSKREVNRHIAEARAEAEIHTAKL